MDGQLGLGQNPEFGASSRIATFRQIADDVIQIFCGDDHTVILKADGTVWVCGSNEYGQLGMGGRHMYSTIFLQIAEDVQQICCGCVYTVILKIDGTVWGCGYDSYGQLGLGQNNENDGNVYFLQYMEKDVQQIVCAEDTTIILKIDGTVWGCGSDEFGQLCLPQSDDFAVFQQIAKDVEVVDCYEEYTLLQKLNGEIWGAGNCDELGINYREFSKIDKYVEVFDNRIKQVAYPKSARY
jgi:alpha-tubulin suppressor-like RCC1 family protein